MIAFVCSTPYQIMVALALNESFDDDVVVDIYVLNHFQSAGKIAANLEREEIFRAVKLVDGLGFLTELRKSKRLRLMRKAWIYLNYRRFVRRYVDLDSTRYDDVYLSVPDVLPQLVLKELHDRNPKLRVHLFEDGLGSYGDAFLQTTPLKRAFSSLTRYDKIIDSYSDLWVFRPELVTGNVKFPIGRVAPIGGHAIARLRRIFEYRATNAISERVVFFEQPLDFHPGLNEEIRSITERLPDDDTLFKLHPRGHPELYEGRRSHPESEVPWEIIAYGEDLQRKMLVSFFSTAVTSCKVMFDYEPSVVFLYEIPELKELWEIPVPLRKFVERFRQTYSDPTRVQIPQSIAEFECMLETHSVAQDESSTALVINPSELGKCLSPGSLGEAIHDERNVQ